STITMSWLRQTTPSTSQRTSIGARRRVVGSVPSIRPPSPPTGCDYRRRAPVALVRPGVSPPPDRIASGRQRAGGTTVTKIESAWGKYPDYRIDLVPVRGTARVWHGDVLLAESDSAVRLEETKHVDRLYFPEADVKWDLFEA